MPMCGLKIASLSLLCCEATGLVNGDWSSQSESLMNIDNCSYDNDSKACQKAGMSLQDVAEDIRSGRNGGCAGRQSSRSRVVEIGDGNIAADNIIGTSGMLNDNAMIGMKM